MDHPSFPASAATATVSHESTWCPMISLGIPWHPLAPGLGRDLHHFLFRFFGSGFPRCPRSLQCLAGMHRTSEVSHDAVAVLTCSIWVYCGLHRHRSESVLFTISCHQLHPLFLLVKHSICAGEKPTTSRFLGQVTNVEQFRAWRTRRQVPIQWQLSGSINLNISEYLKRLNFKSHANVNPILNDFTYYHLYS